MSFSKSDLEKIKSKLVLSVEVEKKTKIIKKGKDYWCCCLFHKEKTPSLKINDEQGSYYCFGCGAKGDIFSLYMELYNFSFQDSVQELAKKAGVIIESNNYINKKYDNRVNTIIKLSSNWFQENLKTKEGTLCKNYLISRDLSEDTINHFKLGFSYNSNKNLYEFLKENGFSDEEILKSNLVKLDNNNKIKDYFYKRLIFPISDQMGNIVGFGGRTLENRNPKYINSPESDFFKKRNILYNLSEAKNTARQKNNLLICEGYMDVIALYQNGIKSVVAPLGTSLTEEQLSLAWKYSSKPTIMFDGDKAGLRAAFKTALMSLSLITSKNFLQFITLEDGFDPDSFIKNYSIDEMLKILKNPIGLVNFVFNESSKTISLENADDKISFDRYLDEIIESIKDKKIKYFYKSEFKTLFFNKLKEARKVPSKNNIKPYKTDISLYNKQKLSFISGYLNHKSIRKEIITQLLESDLFDLDMQNLLKNLNKNSFINQDIENIINSIDEVNQKRIIESSLDSSIYALFPYSSPKNPDDNSLKEITESLKNLNTRLLNLKKINKSLDSFVKNSTELNWEELQNINMELLEDK